MSEGRRAGAKDPSRDLYARVRALGPEALVWMSLATSEWRCSLLEGSDGSSAEARMQEAARLRKRFQLVKRRLLARPRDEGLLRE